MFHRAQVVPSPNLQLPPSASRTLPDGESLESLWESLQTTQRKNSSSQRRQLFVTTWHSNSLEQMRSKKSNWIVCRSKYSFQSKHNSLWCIYILYIYIIAWPRGTRTFCIHCPCLKCSSNTCTRSSNIQIIHESMNIYIYM